MRIGVVLPQTELGGDVRVVRAYAEGVTELGYAHLLAYDHVVGADPDVHAGWTGPYDVTTTFHEPLVLFGYLAAVTDIELVAGVIVLPQRETALAAKQAAEVDLLSGGRFRFGVGVGWNAVEYEALGQRFEQRGRRLSEQVPLLRRLWTEASVTHLGDFDTVTGAGISPLPIQRPIPVWFGGQTDPAYRRIGRLADGWFPQVRPGDDLQRALDVIGAAARDAGRDPDAIGMEGRVQFDGTDPDRFVRQIERWRTAGASHVSIDTMRAGQTTADGHLELLHRAAAVLGL